MLQLTYISTARPDVTRVDVDRILVASRRNNAGNRVSGLLIHDGRRFLQALEGDRGLVEQTFATIRGDDRHRALVLLSQREIATREFGDWAMASHMAHGTSDKATLIETIDVLTASIPDANTRELFRSFARIQRAA